MDQGFKPGQYAPQAQQAQPTQQQSEISHALGKVRKMDDRVSRLEAVTKKIRKEQIKEQNEIDLEAKDRFAYFIEEARSRFNADYDGPDDDERPELDDSDPRDRKVIDSMTNLANKYLDTIVDYGEPTEESTDASTEESTDASTEESTDDSTVESNAESTTEEEEEEQEGSEMDTEEEEEENGDGNEYSRRRK